MGEKGEKKRKQLHMLSILHMGIVVMVEESKPDDNWVLQIAFVRREGSLAQMRNPS